MELASARQLLRDRKPVEAWSALEPLLSREPENIEALLLAGRIWLARDESTGARKYLEKAVSLSPKLHAAQFLLGFCLYIDNDFAPALLALETARTLKSKDGATLLYLALTHEGLAQTDRALALYPRVVANNPSGEAPLAYARLLFTLNRFDSAQIQVKEALRREPRSREAHYEQARLHFEAGSFALAISTAELALQLEGLPQTIRAIHFLLARAYAKNGDAGSAQRHRTAFEAIPPRLVR
jgi:tetratricopeptide (TPR) repeat protein